MSAHDTKQTSGRPEPGHLYLIPTPLGPHPDNQVLSEYVVSVIHSLDTFFVEKIRQANSFLRWINHPIPDFKCHFYELNKQTPGEDLIEMLSMLKKGAHAGIISEAGCPAVADPGSNLVRLAHEAGIPVTPLVGPSSILLAVMGSGLNGQTFTFHGYLPKPGQERTERIRHLQKESSRTNATQIFMETPFRNDNLLAELVQELSDDTLLCAASNLTLPDEQIITRRVSDWRNNPVSLDQKPSIFLILAAGSEWSPSKSHARGETGRQNLPSRKNKKKPVHRRKRA